MNKTDSNLRRNIIRGLIGVDLVLLAWMLYMVAEPYVKASAASSAAKTEDVKLKLPGYDYSPWEVLPVLEGGRAKPLQTVAIESVREITGRARFDDNPPLAILLSWIFYNPGHVAPGGVDWDR